MIEETRTVEQFVTYGDSEHSIGSIVTPISSETQMLDGCSIEPEPVDEVGICECTGRNELVPIFNADGTHYIEVEVDGSIQQYVTNYGSVCGAWDLDLAPICDQSDAPDYCM